jgi:seryl-tRNA synthetase
MRASTTAVAAAFFLAGMSAPALAQLGAATQTSQQAITETERSQGKVDQLDDQAQSLINDYRANLKQLEQLNRYNASQERQITAQQREMASIEADIANIAGLQRSVQPLMEDMLAALEKIVEADLPFQPVERAERIARLKRIMDDPDQSPAQRYRLIVEAYQIENEYGRTIESYRGDVTFGDTEYENVEFLRIGRIALIAKTDDESVLKIFDSGSREWTDLDDSFLPSVRTASRIAREQIPPDLMTIPVSAPVTAE